MKEENSGVLRPALRSAGNENAIMFQPPEPGRKLPLAGEYFIPQGKSGSREDVAPRKVISHAAQGPGSQPESLSFVLQGKGIIHALWSLEKRLHMQNGSERRPVSRLSADRAAGGSYFFQRIEDGRLLHGIKGEFFNKLLACGKHGKLQRNASVGKNNLPVEDDTAGGKYPGKGAYALNNVQAGKDNVVVPDISGNRAYGKQGFMRGACRGIRHGTGKGIFRTLRPGTGIPACFCCIHHFVFQMLMVLDKANKRLFTELSRTGHAPEKKERSSAFTMIACRVSGNSPPIS